MVLVRIHFLREFIPGDLFITTGLFGYPVTLVFYFLYRREVREDLDNSQKIFLKEIEQIEQGMGSEVNNLLKTEREAMESEEGSGIDNDNS